LICISWQRTDRRLAESLFKNFFVYDYYRKTTPDSFSGPDHPFHGRGKAGSSGGCGIAAWLSSGHRRSYLDFSLEITCKFGIRRLSFSSMSSAVSRVPHW
jgi:hypothetical protein